MSLNLVNRNTSSPFHLQRSIVDQGGEGGAYESGGYTGTSAYNNDAANAAIESFGTTIGAALSSRTPEGNNKQDVKTKERLENRSNRLNEKKTSSTNEKKVARIEKRLTNIGERKQKVETRIKTFEEEKKKKIPTATIN